jgi:hypothetical protein
MGRGADGTDDRTYLPFFVKNDVFVNNILLYANKIMIEKNDTVFFLNSENKLYGKIILICEVQSKGRGRRGTVGSLLRTSFV